MRGLGCQHWKTHVSIIGSMSIFPISTVIFNYLIEMRYLLYSSTSLLSKNFKKWDFFIATVKLMRDSHRNVIHRQSWLFVWLFWPTYRRHTKGVKWTSTYFGRFNSHINPEELAQIGLDYRVRIFNKFANVLCAMQWLMYRFSMCTNANIIKAPLSALK